MGGASEGKRISGLDGDDSAPSDGEGQGGGGDAVGERGHRSVTTHTLENPLRAQPSLSSAVVKGLPHLDSDCSAVSIEENRHPLSRSSTFAQDLTHVEVDALLGPTLPWNDPFQENSRTVGELKATSWAACLHSLLGRLRMSIMAVDSQGEKVDGDQMSVEGEKLKSVQTAGWAGEETLEPHPEETEESPQQQQQQQQPQQQCVENVLLTNAAAKSQERLGQKTHPVRRLESSSCIESHGRSLGASPLSPMGLAEIRMEAEAGERVWLDNTMMRVGVRVPWGRLHRGRFAKLLFTVRMGENGRGLNFSALSISPTADPMLRGCWECKATDRDLARFLSSGSWNTHAESSRRGRPYQYDPHRCVGELQERGELLDACAAIARKAFRLVLVFPGGVALSLAGVAIAGGREAAWPQDIEEDRVLTRASTDLQSYWRGFISRKRTRWLRMEREGRRRLSRLRNDIEAEHERVRRLEQEAKDELMLEETRRRQAQEIMAKAAARWLARQENSRERAEQATRRSQIERDADPEHEEATQTAKKAVSLILPTPDDISRAEKIVSSDPEDDGTTRIAASGAGRLERVVTIDGTEVHLIAHVQGWVKDGDANNVVVSTDADDKPVGMLLLAVDKGTRRSSSLSLDAAEVAQITCSRQNGGSDLGAAKVTGAHAALSAVIQKLTLFNSRRKDLFILSYKGKKVVAPH
ncbi:unnamed protein product [Hapterophycus canaliculatus]